MTKVTVRTIEQASRVNPAVLTSGEVEARRYFRPNSPITLCLYSMPAGSSLRFQGSCEDLALFVWTGSVEAEGVMLDARSSAIVEAGAALHLHCHGTAQILAFSAHGQGQRGHSGRQVHLLPNAQVPRADFKDLPGITGGLHADASCPTCDIWLHENDFSEADYEAPVHSHSEDEVIFVRAGTIRLGGRLYGPGTAIAITKDTKYGFGVGPEGLGFVNFRGASPTITLRDGSTLDEAALFAATTGRPRYIERATD